VNGWPLGFAGAVKCVNIVRSPKDAEGLLSNALRVVSGHRGIAALVFAVVAASSGGCAVQSETDSTESDDGVVLSQTSQALLTDAELSAFTGLYKSKDAFLSSCGETPFGSQVYGYAGYEPVAPGPHPVFLYTTGTNLGEDGSSYNNPESLLIVKEMARRGFVAVSVAYANGGMVADCAQLDAKARCVYQDSPNSAMRAICSRSKAGCATKGVVVGGLSQGAMIALRSQNFYSGIKGAWALSVSDMPVGGSCMQATGGSRVLANSKVWVTNGAADSLPGTGLSTLQRVTGWPVDGVTYHAADATRGGYYQVQGSDLQAGNPGGANHVFYRYDDTENGFSFDANWFPPASTIWSLNARLDWLNGRVTH